MEIKITIEGLEQLTEAIALLGSAMACQKGMVNTAKAAVDLIEDATKDTASKKEKPKENEVKKIVQEQPTISIEDVRAKFISKNTKGNTPKLKKILQDHGVKKVTDLKEEDFPSVLESLEAI